MAKRRKKSLEDINSQTIRLMDAAYNSGNANRARRILELGWRYMDGIQRSKSYRNAERKAEERDENGYTSGQLSPNRLIRNVDNRKYSPRTYGKYTGLAKAVSNG